VAPVPIVGHHHKAGRLTAPESRAADVRVGELVAAKELAAAAGLPREHARNPVSRYLDRLAAGSRPAMLSSLATITQFGAGLTGEAGESPEAFRKRVRGAAYGFPWWALRDEHTARLRKAVADRYQPATTNRHLSALRGVLKECWRLELMTRADYEAAVGSLGPIQPSRPEPDRQLSHAELQALFAVCAQEPSPLGPRDAALLAVLAGGLRGHQALALNVDDYEQETGTLRVERAGRRQHGRLVLDRGARAALDAWLEVRREPRDPDRDGRVPLLVSIRRGGRLSPRRLAASRVNRILAERARQAGIPPFTSEQLRRSVHAASRRRDTPYVPGELGPSGNRRGRMNDAWLPQRAHQGDGDA
jgi:integrase/recombinase XerD